MLPSIPGDKANHFLYGALIALAAYAAGLLALPTLAAQAALAAAVVAGVVKEGADRWANLQASRQGLPPPHGVELLDAVATAAGGGLVFVSASLAAWAR